MGNLLIDKRIQKMEMVKASLLKVKKEHRHTTLQEVNGIIARLKRWNDDLEKEQGKATNEKQFSSSGFPMFKEKKESYTEITQRLKQKTEGIRTTL